MTLLYERRAQMWNFNIFMKDFRSHLAGLSSLMEFHVAQGYLLGVVVAVVEEEHRADGH